MISTSLLNALECYSPDTLRELLLYYLHPRDCAALACTSKSMCAQIDDDDLWKHHCSYSIVGLRNHFSVKQVELMKQLLQIENFRMFYMLMRRMKFSFFGWYRLNHSGQHPLLNGGLYSVRVVGGQVVCQRINYNGDIVPGSDSYVIHYESSKGCLVAKSILVPMEYRLELDSSFRMHISGSFTTQEQQHQQMTVQYFTTQQTAANGGDINDFIVMKPLPFALDFNAAPYKMQPYVDFRNCVGLFTAPYGSHGIEILHLSLHPSPGIIPSCIKPNTSVVELFTHFNNYLTAGNGIGMSSSSNSNSIGVDGSSMRQVHQGLELRGLKVSGDPNVPAGKLSFIVNLSNVVDIDTEMANDQRFIVIFPHESPSPTLLSLDQRKHNIAFWARGYGQVNRLPAEWKPEWVGCSFIMYKTPLAHGGATFSLVWDDETDPYFRHAMDFQPLPRGNAPPYSQNSRELFPTVA